jgi:hypothetical protein
LAFLWIFCDKYAKFTIVKNREVSKGDEVCLKTTGIAHPAQTFTPPCISGGFEWEKTAGGGHTGPFAAHTAYKATAILRARAGYAFKDLSGTPVSFVHSDGINSTPGFSTAQYSATIAWSPAPGTAFLPETAYTATLTLAALPGYTFQNDFSHADATVENNLGSSQMKLTFAETDPLPLVTLLNLKPYVDMPAAGQPPVRTIVTSQYTGTVEWAAMGGNAPEFGLYTPNGPFVGGLTYQATLYLVASPGYSLDIGRSPTSGGFN